MKRNRIPFAWPLLCLMLFVGPLAAQQVTGLQVWHRAGQTFLTWNEQDPLIVDPDATFLTLRRELENADRIRYRIYRSAQPITTVNPTLFVGETLSLSNYDDEYYGSYPNVLTDSFPYDNDLAIRYVAQDGPSWDQASAPVDPGTGIYVHNPQQSGSFYYAVSVVEDGVENMNITSQNSLQNPIQEGIGDGVPVLQKVTHPSSFEGVSNPTLYYYARWEAPPRAKSENRPIHYLVAVPPNVLDPAPVGVMLHAWGESFERGFATWFNGNQGSMIITSNQIPYDWWTGYHENASWNDSCSEWGSGVVRPYTQNRMISFLHWVDAQPQWNVDLTQTFTGGWSMGGSGSGMLGMRHGDKIAWVDSWVGVHIPLMSYFSTSYAGVYGPVDEVPQGSRNFVVRCGKDTVKFEDGTPVWDYFDDSWYLRQYPTKETAFITFANGKNDGDIGWPQAVRFYEALQETKRPHLFKWGQNGHGEQARMPLNGSRDHMPIDIRTDQSLPAFTKCSLDDDPGDGTQSSGDDSGLINGYLFWETSDIVDTPDEWQITIGLTNNPKAPEATVDVTPRRLQAFRVNPGEVCTWTNTSLVDINNPMVIQSGQATADPNGLVTIPDVTVTTGKNRIALYSSGSGPPPVDILPPAPPKNLSIR